MKPVRSFLSILGALLIAAGAQAQNSVRGNSTPARNASVDYRVVPALASETFEVAAVLNNVAGDTITFQFPIWGPGAYDIVNFGSYVQSFTATSGTGRPLKVIRGDTNTFRIIGGDGKVNIVYKMHDIENSPTSLWFGLSDIENDYVFANTPAIFGYPAGYKNVPYTVSYAVPKGWDIAIGLDPAPGKYNYRAHDYDELVDAPVTMGKFQRLEFTAGGKPHLIAVFAPEKLSSKDASDLVSATKQVVEIVSGFYGDMPYDRYVFQHFLVHPSAGDAIFGALEHRNSSTYRMPLYGGGAADILRGVIAHEYWHAWSPKRIHVAELGPFDYQHAPHTSSLWFAEGLTEYYAQVLLARNGLKDKGEVVSTLNNAVTGFYGRKQAMSIGDLSLHISELKPEQVLPLYSKGPILGLLLDAAIRSQTNNAKSLDDAMRYFNQEYGKTGKTFSDDEIIPIMERATGAKLADFYDRYILGHEPLPFDEYLPKIGFKMLTTFEDKRTLGATVEMTERGWKIATVEPGGSASKMGMQVGDVITMVNFKRKGMAATDIPVAYADVIATMRDVESFTVVRATSEMNVPAAIVNGKVATHRVEVDPAASATASAARKDIFGF
jgi:predicted metalloprotease with PDZ domain